MNLYLITGFLGAGKTTFLKQFLKQFSDKRLWLIINEFGKAGVDGEILKQINAVMSEISNGSIFCACRLDHFEDELRQTVKDKPDIILVEASGLSDPTNVQTVIGKDEFSSINYRGSICLVDAPRLEKVIHTARVCPKQIMVSSLILLNKTDIATEQQLKNDYQLIQNLNPFAIIKETKFGEFKQDWFEYIHPLSSNCESNNPDIQLQKQMIEISSKMSISQLNGLLRMIAEDTWRIKGFVQLENHKLLVDCVGPTIKIENTNLQNNDINRLVLLAGAGMPLRKAVKNAKKWYGDLIWEVK